jgi:hypothetical protein
MESVSFVRKIKRRYLFIYFVSVSNSERVWCLKHNGWIFAIADNLGKTKSLDTSFCFYDLRIVDPKNKMELWIDNKI